MKGMGRDKVWVEAWVYEAKLARWWRCMVTEGLQPQTPLITQKGWPKMVNVEASLETQLWRKYCMYTATNGGTPLISKENSFFKNFTDNFGSNYSFQEKSLIRFPNSDFRFEAICNSVFAEVWQTLFMTLPWKSNFAFRFKTERFFKNCY